MTHRVDPNQTSTAGALSDLTHSLGRKGRASTPVPGRRTDGNYMPVRMRDGQRAKPGVRCGCSAPVLHRHELGSQRSRSFQGQASASVPAPLRSTGQDLDVALHLTINVAQPRPLLSDNKVVEMRRRPNAQSVLRASPRCAV